MPRLRPAFTLTQLLVTVAVLTLLLALLLPTLTRIRQQSQQAKCMSNLRQLGTIYTLYANASGGQIPLGYSNGMPWNGYFLWDGIGFPLSGRLFKAGFINASPKAFYCPSQIDPRWQFNTSPNPWPASTTINPPALPQIRVGYSSRPTVEWAPGSAQPLGPMSQLQLLQNKAILADVIGIPQSSPDYTSVHHRRLNVLAADNSVRNVALTAYQAAQNAIQPYNALPNTVPLSLYLDDSSPTSPALWNSLDRN